ncbi:MAG TPA: hypothetical protein VFP23_02010 [Solirubrobacterales bacterium]|nr:hypothetical protein [Solirubrobacterales bacterium]
MQVDVSGMAGVSMSATELFADGSVLRPGSRIRLTVPSAGGELINDLGGPLEAVPWRGQVRDEAIIREWDWPHERGPAGLQSEIDAFKATLRRASETAARRLAVFNAELAADALTRIESRRTEVLARREFLGDLKMAVRARPDAPGPITPPPVRRRPAALAATPPEAPSPPPIGEDDLDHLYLQILQSTRAMGQSLERTPSSFATKTEEELRDHFLLILNTNYEDQAYGEAFNKDGKTDVLIRVDGRTVFIAECKWWNGKAGIDSALAQLYGYATWRDSRLALIFFVRAKNVTSVFDTAATTLESREEIYELSRDAAQRELRCRLHWPDDDDRRAELTVQFFHLPPR